MVDRAASHVAGRRGETDPLFKQSTGEGGMADLEYGGEQKIKADFIFRVYARVERFDRRGTEPFELFPSEFGQNSLKISEFSLENLKNSENINIF